MTNQVAIIDYGMGNLFSVARACEEVGLTGRITSNPAEVLASDAVILPGVGAFGGAIDALNAAGLSDALRRFVETGRPFFGVCLGIQLLMTTSTEFGNHEGLGLVDGVVVRFEPRIDDPSPAKVPQMQWNQVRAVDDARWQGGLLRSLPNDQFFYFVHSYYVVPADPTVVVATTRYAGVEFASAIQRDNVFACQFHPERSGPQGLSIYRNLAMQIGAAAPAAAGR